MTRNAWRYVLPGAGCLLLPAGASAAEPGAAQAVSLWLTAPFVLMLLSIAVVPFINKHWWERWYPAVALGLGAFTAGYYVAVLGDVASLSHTAVEYLGFICLIGSLFVIAGGIHIRIKGKSGPLANVVVLLVGALLSNLVGTTGASMILIRPYIRLNQYRIRAYHIVFFIFVVANMGGALTPIGDPPLFLGYLKGIPFFWVAEHLWFKWGVAIAAVLGVFYAVDYRAFMRLPHAVRHGAEGLQEEWDVSGMHNVVFLLVVLVAVFLTNPPFLREGLMVAAAAGSYLTTKSTIHKKNGFDFQPIKEVALLFIGIFVTMVPALQWLEQNAGSIGIRTAGQFYWATGVLSSVLDNAPTYLNFLSAATGLYVGNDTVQQVHHLIQAHGNAAMHFAQSYSVEVQNTLAMMMKYHGANAGTGMQLVDTISMSSLIGNNSIFIQSVSLGAVFFGAMTYIGNGPNFMVKSIAEQSGVRCPTFFGYTARYALPILLPVFTLIWILFFRG